MRVPGDFEDVAIALAARLNFQRVRGLAQKIEWGPILVRLEKALDDAINASMKTEGALALDGGVTDFIEGSQDWYLTTNGLYCPEISYHLSPKHFRHPRRRGSPSPTLAEAPPLEKPEGVKSESEWKYVFQLAKDEFGPNFLGGYRTH